MRSRVRTNALKTVRASDRAGLAGWLRGQAPGPRAVQESTATAAPRRVLLREDLVHGLAPLPASSPRVDRKRGIVRGVKIVGRLSPNSHNTAGATEGTEYTLEALRTARPLYERAAVYANHPPREKPDRERPIEEILGELLNVRVEESGLYADLKVMKSHPMAERVFEAAEEFPTRFGMSHNAYGVGTVVNGRYVITKIPQVRSVDLVSSPATTRGLFESRERDGRSVAGESIPATGPCLAGWLRS